MGVATYTVLSVQGEPREWEGKFGKNVSYTLALKDVDGVVELSQKPETPAPSAGQTLEGEIQPSNGNFPPRFKRAQRGGNFGGGGGGMSPERERRITRLHSQEMALRYLNLKAALGTLPESFSLGGEGGGDFKKLIDWFDKDAGV